MHISDELLDFCSGFHQDLMLYGPEPPDWIKGALGFVTPERLPVFRDYLAELLARDYSGAQLKEMFVSANTDTIFLDIHYLRIFITAVRDTTGGKPVQL